MKISKVIPVHGFQAIEFDGDVNKLHHFLRGKAKNCPTDIQLGSWLVATYHGVIILSNTDFQNNYKVIEEFDVST